jgi:ABC-type glycerol-3-phosphate transport system substrate-binding protein
MRRKMLAVGAAAVVVLGIAVFLVFRDRSVVIAVPSRDLPVYAKVLGGMAGRDGAPRLRLFGFTGSGEEILTGKRPGLAVVSLASWVSASSADGRLSSIPRSVALSSMFPQALIQAVGSGKDGLLHGLPIVFDPWLVFWHRDFIGGPSTSPPRDWKALEAAAARWKRGGASAVAIAGREPDALAAWLAVLGGARGPAAAADALGGFPLRGREALEDGLARLAAMEQDGIAQPAAFSYLWADAINLVLQKHAAGIFLPLSRFRSINAAASAPLLIAQVPEFPGVAGFGLVAELRVLVMPFRGARGRGAEKVIAFLGEPGSQRALADGLGMVPARADAPVRDGASFEGREAARRAALFLPVPGIAGDARNTAAFAEAAAAVLRSPGDVAAAVAALYAGR